MNLWRRIFKYLPLGLKIKLLDWYLKKEGIVVKIAQTPEEKEQVYRLRFEVYAGEDHVDPGDYPDRRIEDKYDRHAVSFLALKDDQPVGSVRLIYNSALGFPTENLFNILQFPDGFSPDKTLELSKLVVKKGFRNGFVSMGLLASALNYSADKGMNCWYLSTTSKLIGYFRDALGVDFIRLSVGLPKPEHLEERAVAAKRYFQKSILYPYILKLNDLRKS